MVHIRPYREADFNDAVGLLRATFHATWEPHLSAEARTWFAAQDISTHYVTTSGTDFLLAERDRDIVGMVHANANFIEALHVMPGNQRQGIGHGLLAHAEAAMRHAGHRWCRLETDTFNMAARSFYAKNNYSEIDFYPDTEWRSNFTTVLLEKRLSTLPG